MLPRDILCSSEGESMSATKVPNIELPPKDVSMNHNKTRLSYKTHYVKYSKKHG
jgi:hypothetical protein